MTSDVPSDIAGLRLALLKQREYTLALYANLPDSYWRPNEFPFLSTVNPPLWELAHIGWFQEFFALRWHENDVEGAGVPSCLAAADKLFDSRGVAHDTRWHLNYPSRSECLDYMQRVLTEVVTKLQQSNDGDREGFQLALLHEDMHSEALAMTLTTIGLPLPGAVPQRLRLEPVVSAARQIFCEGGAVHMGASERSFTFDNEMPVQIETIRPFSIDAQAVSAGEFTSFVCSSAFDDSSLWSAEGLAWKERVAGTSRHSEPSRHADDVAAMHVNYFQAEAYCRWISRRLPTEAEWEHAAIAHARFANSNGHVWEWTSSPFAPRSGFREGRYREYSQPWFHTHQVLKGGSFVTHPRLKYAQYRNFYTPDRRDMFCGFRTCAST